MNNNYTFGDTLGLLRADDIAFLEGVAQKEVWDYTPLEEALRCITDMAHARLAEKTRKGWHDSVEVVPRGSFVSRTALRDSADLDIDFIIPDDWRVKLPNNGDVLSIRDALQVDDYNENILFSEANLNTVLRAIWLTLCNPDEGSDGVVMPGSDKRNAIDIEGDVNEALEKRPWLIASFWLDLRVDPTQFTRSIPAQTNYPVYGRPLDIDIFIKIKTVIRGTEYIVGVDKNGPGGIRRYQTTDYIPNEGKWIGDRILGPVERSALMMLKWWKVENAPRLKSHHLLTALNAIYELDLNDELYFPKKSSTTFSTKTIKKLMINILLYLDRAYAAPWGRLFGRQNFVGEITYDYPFPQVSVISSCMATSGAKCICT